LVSALQFDIIYDNTAITAADIELDTTISNHIVLSNEISPGVHRIVIYSSVNNPITDSMVITIPFTVLETGTETTLELNNIVLSDNDSVSIAPAQVQNATVTLLAKDTDNDGIADAWEKQYFVTLTVADSTSDYDNEGFKDLYEYLAGTDPTDPNSLLKISNIKPIQIPSDEKNSMDLTWTCVSGKTYKIFWREDLSTSDWDEVNYTGIENDIICNGDGTQSWSDEGKDDQMNGELPSDVTARFYKVNVNLDD
jgi:hypothetical protein